MKLAIVILVILLLAFALYHTTQVRPRDTFASNAVRFQPGSAEIYYNIGSDTMEITRTYGTVANGQRFPSFMDVMYGYHSLPPLPDSEKTVNVSGNFKPV